jgi:hypothetical protein
MGIIKYGSFFLKFNVGAKNIPVSLVSEERLPMIEAKSNFLSDR